MEKRLNDLFPGWLSGEGIFGALQNFSVPWKSENIAVALDVEYHGNHSGDKLISPLLFRLSENGSLTANDLNTVAIAIMAVCGTNWGKMWETMSFDYNPIENYSMTEQMENEETVTSYGKTRTRTNNLSHTKTGSDTDKPNITETQTPNLSNSSTTKVNGFNSSVGVPSGSETQTASGTNTNTQTGTNTREYNTTDLDTGTQNDNDGGKDTQTRNYKLTRSGNIGVTTSQQMIQSERDLWLWNFFRDVVFPDVDKILTIPIY